MEGTFTKVFAGVVRGYDLVEPVVDVDTGELLGALPMHTVELWDEAGHGGRMRVNLTEDRCYAYLPVGSQVTVELRIPFKEMPL